MDESKAVCLSDWLASSEKLILILFLMVAKSNNIEIKCPVVVRNLADIK
jgi:hypothetical protein